MSTTASARNIGSAAAGVIVTAMPKALTSLTMSSTKAFGSASKSARVSIQVASAATTLLSVSPSSAVYVVV